LLDLNPARWSILQSDVDGGVMKVANFARSLSQLKRAPVQRIDPVSKQERTMALRHCGTQV
jgi:hypothetical protein